MKYFLMTIMTAVISVYSQTSTINYIQTITYPNGLENLSIPGLSAGEQPNATALSSIGYFNGWAQEMQSQSLSDQTGKVLISRKFYDLKGRLIVSGKLQEMTNTGLNFFFQTMSAFLTEAGADSAFERLTYLNEPKDRIVSKCLSDPYFTKVTGFPQFSYFNDLSYNALVTQSTDEDGNSVREYTDIFGRKIRQEVEMGANDLITTFEYDARGRLIKSYQPEAYKLPLIQNQNQQLTLSYSSAVQSITYTRPVNSLSATVQIWKEQIPNCGPIEPYANEKTAAYATCCPNSLTWQYRYLSNGTPVGLWQDLTGESMAIVTLSGTVNAVEVQKTSLVLNSGGTCEGSYTVKMHVDATASTFPETKYMTEYKYNTLDQMTVKSSPDEGTTQYIYDAMGRLRFVQDQNRRNKINYKGVQTTNYFWMYAKYDELGRVIRQGEFNAGTSNASIATLYDSIKIAPDIVTYQNIPFSGDHVEQNIGTSATSGSVTYNLRSNTVSGTAQFTAQKVFPPSCSEAYQQDSVTLGVNPIPCSLGQDCPCCQVTYSGKYWFEPGGSEYSNYTAFSGNANITLVPGKDRLVVKIYNITQSPGAYLKCERANITLHIDASGQYQQTIVTPSSRIYNGTSSYPTTNNTDLVWNYYDSYTFTGAPANNLTLPGSYSNYPKGRLTKTIIRDPNTDTYTEEVFFYDQYGRVVTKMAYISEIGTKRVDYYYDASGRVLKTAYQSGQSDAVYSWYEYDNLSRLKKTYSSRTNDKNTATKDAEYAYENINGKIKQLILGNNIQTIDYTYNMRDWLKQINDVNSMGTDKFAMTLSYDDAAAGSATTARYNGNIRSQKWLVAGQSISGYDYNYDKANRLIDANFQDQNKYSEKSLSYDANGNINALTRHLNSSSATALTYTYGDANIPNKLTSVAGLFSATYQYDANGNMTNDNLKGGFTYDYRNMPIKIDLNNGDDIYYAYDQGGQRIRKLIKNSSGVLQTDSRIYVRGTNGQIIAEYKYDGSVWKTDHFNLYGSGLIGKLKGETSILNISGQTISSSQSADSMLITNSSVQAGSNIIIQANGGLRVQPTFNSNGATVLLKSGATGGGGGGGSSAARYYYLADHLGSTRVVIDDAGNVDSWSDYYPFGKESRGSSSSNEPKEQFTGKERDAESGLDYFGARYYNSEIVRWISIDPLWQKHPDWNSYNYVLGNPIRLVDPDGKQIEYAIALGSEAGLIGVAAGMGYLAYKAFDQLKQDLQTLSKFPLSTRYPIQRQIPFATPGIEPTKNLEGTPGIEGASIDNSSQGIEVDQGFHSSTNESIQSITVGKAVEAKYHGKKVDVITHVEPGSANEIHIQISGTKIKQGIDPTKPIQKQVESFVKRIKGSINEIVKNIEKGIKKAKELKKNE